MLARNEFPSAPTHAMTRIARYYYSEGYKKPEIRQKIEEYMLRCDPSINIVSWQKSIDRIVAQADKYELVEIDCVTITKKEFDMCKSSGGILKQKVLFAMLCFAKFYNTLNSANNGWVNQKDTAVFTAANTAIPLKEQSLIIGSLADDGYIDLSKKVNNINTRVTFIDNEGKPFITVTDFRNLGNKYQMVLGKPFIECKNCGLVVRRNSSRQKYCPTCAKSVNRAQSKERMKDVRVANQSPVA